MNIRLFFLKQDGWFEAELTEKLLHATDEDLIRWAYAMMERYHYRNYRITEKPHPCLRQIPGRVVLRAMQDACPVNETGRECRMKSMTDMTSFTNS